MNITVTGIGYSQETVVDALGNLMLEDYYALEQNANGQVIAIDLQNGLYSDLGPNLGTDWGFEGLSYQTSPSLGVTGAEAVFQSHSTGAIFEENLNLFSGQPTGSELVANVGPSWHLIDTQADFNGDGKDDFLFQNSSTGLISVWEMNGSNVIGHGPVGVAPGWNVVGTVDANGDGKSDIVLQNSSTGQVSVWEMNGSNVIGHGPVGPALGAEWQLQVAQTSPSGHGNYELIFQNKVTNQAADWSVHGMTPVSSTTGSFPGSDTILGKSVSTSGVVSSYYEDMSNNLHVVQTSATSVISGYSGTPVAWTVGPHQA